VGGRPECGSLVEDAAWSVISAPFARSIVAPPADGIVELALARAAAVVVALGQPTCREVRVTAEEWALAVSVFFSGLAAGLLGMLTTILHPMLAEMDGPDFRRFMETFLRHARKSWFNYAWSLGMGIGPIVAIVLLWGGPDSSALVVTAIGLGVVVVGVYVVANVWKEPHYDVMLAWDPEAMPDDWEAGRRRYFTINWIQLATTWAAFGLFLAALTSV
jgi:hypothetical protein